MSLIKWCQKHLTWDLSRNPVPAPTPKRKIETQAAHYALKTIRANTHAKLMAEVGR
jgi:hypothetical protein